MEESTGTEKDLVQSQVELPYEGPRPSGPKQSSKIRSGKGKEKIASKRATLAKRAEVVRDWCCEKICDEVFHKIECDFQAPVNPDNSCPDLARAVLLQQVGPKIKLSGKWENCYDEDHIECTNCQKALANRESCNVKQECNETYVRAEDQALVTLIRTIQEEKDWGKRYDQIYRFSVQWGKCARKKKCMNSVQNMGPRPTGHYKSSKSDNTSE